MNPQESEMTTKPELDLFNDHRDYVSRALTVYDFNLFGGVSLTMVDNEDDSTVVVELSAADTQRLVKRLLDSLVFHREQGHTDAGAPTGDSPVTVHELAAAMPELNRKAASKALEGLRHFEV